jgi:hypothetical protein
MNQTPQEQLIVDQIADWLREITWANGYRTNAGLTVYTDESMVPDEPTSEALLVLDLGAKAISPFLGKWTLSIMIEGLIVLTALDQPDYGRIQARRLLADVRDVLKKGRIRSQLPAGATGLREVVRNLPRRKPGANLLLLNVMLEIEYSDLFLEA